MSTEYSADDYDDMSRSPRERALIALWLIRAWDVSAQAEYASSLSNTGLVGILQAQIMEAHYIHDKYPDEDTRLSVICGMFEMFQMVAMGVDMNALPITAVFSLGSKIVGAARPDYHLIDEELNDGDDSNG